MATGHVHTVYKHGEWVNSVAGDGDLDRRYPTKDDAVAAGRAEAQTRKTEHVIHNQDGTISERNSYGNDPADRPG